MPRPRLNAALVATAALLLGGCLNRSDTITGTQTDPTPDLDPSATVPPASRSSGPSVRSLDRRNWDVVRVDAPRGQVEHQPTYDEPLVLNGGAARNGERFPTTQDAIALGSDPGAAAAEGALEAGWPAVLLVLSPARMALGMPPWLTMQAPLQADGTLPSAQRTGAPGLWLWVAPDGKDAP